jgi:hypothetical protein
VDDFYGLDRFDRWLNSQRGLRGFFLLWLDGMPLAVLLGLALLGWLVMKNLSGASTPGLRTAVAVCIVLAVPGGFLMSGLQTIAVRGARSDPRRFQPRFSWRRSVYLALITSAPAFNLAYLSIGRRLPPASLWSWLLAAIATVAMFYWNDRYLRQAAQARLARAPGMVS